MIKRLSIITLAVSLFFGCSEEFKESFSQLQPLREAIIKEFGEKNVRVNLQNGRCIGVAFINTQFNDQSDEDQEAVRKRTLELISSMFSENKNITMAWVSFVEYKNYFFLFKYSNSLNTVFYEKNGEGDWVKS